MSAQPIQNFDLSEARSLKLGRRILESEATAITQLSQSLGVEFTLAINAILECRGSIIVTGMGKAGLIGQKVAASFSSTGTPSHFMHPAEAIHGDLGTVRSDDIVLLLSYSGETEEITRLLPSLRQQSEKLIAITSRATSTLGRGADIVLELGEIEEACPIKLAPSSTTTAMLALGDAIVLVTSENRGFTRENFARFHPGGALGRSLTPVEQMMRPLSECRVALESQTLRQVLVKVSRPGRRTGAVMLVDENNILTGVFTDSDLAKLLENSGEHELDQPISNCMTKRFQTVKQGEMLPVAMEILASKKISELPVVDRAGSPLGLIDITDVMSTLSIAWANSIEDEADDRPRQSSSGSPKSNAPNRTEHLDAPNIYPLRRPENT